MKSKLLLGLVALLTGAALHAQPVTTSGGVSPGTATSPNWAVGSDLTIGTNTRGTLTIADGGTVTVNSGGGTVLIGDGGGGTLNIGAYDLSGTAGTLVASGVSFGNVGSYFDDSAINFNQTDDIEFSIAISGGGWSSVVRQRGTGTTTLSGNNSAHTGDIKVNDGAIIIAGATGARDVTVSGTADATLRVTTGGTLTAGSFYVANEGGGTLRIDGGGQATGYAGGIGSGGHTGEAIVTGTSSKWTLQEDILIGDGGNGTLTLAEGGNFTTTNGTVRLTTDTDSTGTLNFGSADLANPTTTGTLTAATIVFGDGYGNSGAGVINFNQTDALTLDAAIAGTGTINQRGAGTTTLSTSAYFSAINVTAGTLAFTNALSLIGESTLTVTGTGALTTGTKNLNLGLNTDDNTTLLISGPAASVTNQTSSIGYAAGSTGTVTVSHDSTWTNTAELHLGEYGSGSLILGDTAADTATVTATNVVLGVRSGATGDVTINGGSLTASGFVSIGYAGGSTGTFALTGGNLVSSGEVRIGDSGAGSLTLSSGTLTSSLANIARSAGSTGTVTMTGGAWNNSSLLVVGNAGTGTFTQSGGTVTATEGHIGYNSVGTGTLNLLGGGAITLNGGAGTLNIARVSGSTGTLNLGAYDLSGTAGTLNATSIAFGSGAGTVNFNQTDDLTVSAAISGHGTVNQRGSGTTTLTGLNTYTGATNILDGTLALGDGASLSGTTAITVASGAIFDVSALTGDFTLGAGQTLTGGGTILGDLAFGAGSIVLFSLGGYDFDALTVDGDLTYAGALTLSLVNGFTLLAGDELQLFDVTGDYNGAFSSITFTNAALGGSFNYATGTLTVSAVPEPSTYAVIFGVLALGFVIWRRRRP